jgi:hypothetical protein
LARREAAGVRPRTLRGTQEWLLDEIVRREEAPPRKAPPGRAKAAAVIKPSWSLRPAERVEIYARMYFARLHEALGADYPVVRRIVGEDAFERLARAYVTRHPPRSYTLNHLGDRFPGFVARHEPLGEARPLVREVARLERAMSEVFDAEAVTPLGPADLARVGVREWPRARLVPVPGLRVLSFGRPANAVVTAVRERGELPEETGPRRTFVAVYRKDDRVWRLGLDAPAYAALATLVRGGRVADAVAAAEQRWRGPEGGLEGAIRRWFAEWAAEGLFARVESGRRRARAAGARRRRSARSGRRREQARPVTRAGPEG